MTFPPLCFIIPTQQRATTWPQNEALCGAPAAQPRAWDPLHGRRAAGVGPTTNQLLPKIRLPLDFFFQAFRYYLKRYKVYEYKYKIQMLAWNLSLTETVLSANTDVYFGIAVNRKNTFWCQWIFFVSILWVATGMVPYCPSGIQLLYIQSYNTSMILPLCAAKGYG